MKKRVFFGISIIFLIISFSFVIAQEDDAELSVEDKGYACLRDKVEDRTCDALTTEEKIFSLLAIRECKDELIADSQDDSKCWPDGNCNLKTTAQAILALNDVNYDTSKAEEWLLSQNTTSAQLDWYLQIESSKPVSCTITPTGPTGTTDVEFGEDKTITSLSGGTCFTGSQVGDYWLKISSSCYDREFTTSCNESFFTTLLYQKAGGDSPIGGDFPIYVSGTTRSGEAEKVNSFCFKRGGTCRYEGSLWAAVALDPLGNDMTPYLPYLVVMEGDNKNYFPEAFLWHLTGDTTFYNDLLNRQTSFGSAHYWDIPGGGGRYYDTALALYFIQLDSDEKTNAVNWLSESQQQDGCWSQGSIRDTAFVLYSLFGTGSFFGGNGDGNGNGDGLDGALDCEVSGYYCMSGLSCLTEAGGSILEGYDCGAGFVCCSEELTLDSCFVQGGEICGSGEICQGGNSAISSDTDKCCIGGTCVITTGGDEYTCESNDGICRIYGCNDDEEESFTYSCEFGDSCCFSKTAPADGGEGGRTSTIWIWVLVILIVLVVLGIIFKDVLRRSLFRAKSGFGRGRARPGYGRRPGYPPPSPLTGRPDRMPMPREMPPSSRRRPPARPRGELGDVLKKLKEMGR